MSPGSCNHDRAPQYYAESINSNVGFWGYRCRKWVKKERPLKKFTVSFVWSAHWYLYVLGLCKMQEDDELMEMGYYVNNS